MTPAGSSSRRWPPVALGSAALLVCMIVTCFAALPWTASSMRRIDPSQARMPPSAAHPLGTDDLGRDLLARLLYGGALSLSLGLLAAGVAVVIGTAYGALAGFVGGRTDELLMRFVDLLYALPTILLVMLLTVAVGDRLARLPIAYDAAAGRWDTLNPEWARFLIMSLAIGGVGWLTMARVVRGQVLSLREQPFVDAARGLGLPTSRILIRHILPNVVGTITVFATLTVPQTILQESFLSFLGIGVQAPQATWGSLAAEGVRALSPIGFDWWLLVFPCAALSLTLLALNLLGDHLRDRFDVCRRAR